MSEKIGIFGGTFNPFHRGHLNSLQTVLKRANLSKIYVVPAAQNPLKREVEGPSPKQRLEILEIALRDYKDKFVIDDQELNKGGVSYTIETVRHYVSKLGSDNVFLILGADAFQDFDLWKNFEDLLKESNILVTTRPNSPLPLNVKEFPAGVQPFIKDFDFSGIAKLKSGRKIQFVQLKDVDVSATQIRKRLRSGRNVDNAIALDVENYLKQNDIYPLLSKKIADFEQFTRFCGQIMFDKKAIGVKGFDLRNIDSPTEYSLIASGTSARTTAALADNIVKLVKDEYGAYPLSVEGIDEGRWVLIDFGALIIHIFFEAVRQDYRLEDLWKRGKDLNLVDQEKSEK